MEFDKKFFGYDPEKDKDRPIKFRLVHDHKDWYDAYWMFDDEVKPTEIPEVKKLGFIGRLINKLKSMRKNVQDPWKPLRMYLNPYVENSVHEGWMTTGWEFRDINGLLSQLDYLTKAYPTIKDLYRWDLHQIGKCESFIRWKREVNDRRSKMPESCE